ncbi:MAG: Smr/MutS family protein [Treponema sp.]|nr:Smr/MutS family protein [Treponema sp.]MCL2271736.1 Smr/MutS family protein [Treponema sp.]
MSFADILDKWERISDTSPKNELEEWLRKNETIDKDSDREKIKTHSEKRMYLRRKKPDDILDIHGLTGDKAWISLDLFFSGAKDKRYKKLRIIHGKGNKSQGDAVLTHTVRRFLEKCPYAGENGFEKAANGGTGATWVFLK